MYQATKFIRFLHVNGLYDARLNPRPEIELMIGKLSKIMKSGPFCNMFTYELFCEASR